VLADGRVPRSSARRADSGRSGLGQSGAHDLPGLPSGHEHYERELAELVASTTGPLDAAIADLRARHDIEQLTPTGDPRAAVNTPARLASAAIAAGGAKPGRSQLAGRSTPLRNVLSRAHKSSARTAVTYGFGVSL